MADPSTVRRKLFMHQAHHTVGVSGSGVAIGPYCRMERRSADGPTIAATHVVLAACQQDADARAAMASFRRAIGQRRDIECRYVDIDALRAGWVDLSDADCLVVLNRGLHVARRWSDLDAAAPADEGPNARTPLSRFGRGAGDEGPSERPSITPLSRCGRGAGGEGRPPSFDDHGPVTVEIVAAAQRHPVLEGVKPFASHPLAGQPGRIPADATVLLARNTPTEVFPVAWIQRCGQGPVFSTTLGSPEDFRQPAFVRLMLNALAWVGR